MTTRAAFSPEEWTSVLQGPPSAGMIVIAAASGGMFPRRWDVEIVLEARDVHAKRAAR